MTTPHAVHYGTAHTLDAQRAQTLELAYAAQLVRFKGRVPKPPALSTAAWINPKKGDRRNRNYQRLLAKFKRPCVSK